METLQIQSLYKPEYYSRIIPSALQMFDEFLRDNGSTKIVVNTNYYQAFNSSVYQYEVEILDFLKMLENEENQGLMCTEMLSPVELVNRFKEILPHDSNYDLEPTSFFFMGSNPNYAPLHFDWDFNNVNLIQLTGRKRIILFEPKFGQRFSPVFNTSAIDFRNLEKSEQDFWIKSNNGQEYILEPGDVLYIPKLWWHYVEYLDIATSINFRFGNNALERRLCTLPRNHVLQDIGYTLWSAHYDSAKSKNVVNECLKVFYKKYENPLIRYDSCFSLYREFHKEICADSVRGPYFGPNFDLEINLCQESINEYYNPINEIDDIFDKLNQFESEKVDTHMKYYGYTSFDEMNDTDLLLLINSLHNN